MPKLDLSRAIAIKSAGGEVAALRGPGFSWRPFDPAARLAVHVDADIDTVGERDDIPAVALWLATQDRFRIVGLTASAPDSNAQEFRNCIAAYAADRDVILGKGKDPADFLTQAELEALVLQGAKVDAPARGYWIAGEAGYAAAHACAQLLISNAQEFGSTGAGPWQKLWVVIQGGYTTLAQAAYEAVELGQCPDFFDRIRVVGQPNWNSSWAPNAWGYLFSRMWPAPDDPGLFGNAWMLSGYLQWHAFNRDNGGSDRTFWTAVTADSAMGAHLRSLLTRPGGAFTSPHFRAGDAGAWFWLMSALERGNFDPENPDNWCGAYRTYVGRDPWPSQTVGYGAGSGLGSVPNPEGVTWSPRHFAPDLSVNSFAAAEDAVALDHWYALVAEVMALYQADPVVEEPEEPGDHLAGLVGEWLLDEGSGMSLADAGPNGLTGRLGLYEPDPGTSAPAWVAEGLSFTPQQVAVVPYSPLLDHGDLTVVVVVRPDTTSGNQMFASRSEVPYPPGSPARNVFQLRNSSGALQFLGFAGGTVNVAAAGAVAVGQWMLVAAQNVGTAAVLRKNGAQVAAGSFNAPMALGVETDLRFGGRFNSTASVTDPVDGLDGTIAYVAIYEGLSSADLPAVEERARQAVASKGISL